MDAPEPIKKAQDWKRIFPALVVSALAFAAVFYFADLNEILAAFSQADFRLVVLVFFLTLMWVILRSFVWRTLLQEKATFSQVFLTVNEGYLINNVLPLRLGEIARAFLLSRKANLDFWQVFSTILIERVLDLVIAAGFLLISLPFVIGVSWAMVGGIGAGLLVLLGLGFLYLVARNQAWTLKQFQRLTHRWPRLERPVNKHLQAFLSGLDVLIDGKRFLKAVGWMAANWSIAILQYYILLKAFIPEAQVLWAMFVLGGVALASAVPSLPGSLGMLELGMVGVLSTFRVEEALAVAITWAGRAANYIITGVLGVYALANDGLSLLGVYKQIKDFTPNDSAGDTP